MVDVDPRPPAAWRGTEDPAREPLALTLVVNPPVVHPWVREPPSGLAAIRR